MAEDKRGLYIPPEILLDRQLSPPQKIVLSAMSEMADKDNICYASAAMLERRIGMEYTAVRSNRCNLKKLGYLEHLHERTSPAYRLMRRYRRG